MASPSNMSPWPGVSEPLQFPAPEVHATQKLFDPNLILNRLREQIANGSQGLDALLGTIAIAAESLTEATGAALGMRRDGTVICVGRSGETAPALGARLSGDSGISGECLRTGRSQRCDDAESDPRVDAEVCRHLGLRSIAAVPVRSRLETIGILEVFSSIPRAFNDEHLAWLSSLAELADAATATKISDASTVSQENSAVAALAPTAAPTPLTVQWTHSHESRKTALWVLGAAGGVVLLALLSFASWRMWHELQSRSVLKPATVQASAAPSQPVAETNPSAASNLFSKPTPEEIAPASASKSTHKDHVVNAAKIESEPDDGLIRNIPDVSAAKTPTHDVDAPTNVPPQVSIVSTPDDSLHGLLSNQTELPKLGPPVSQGVRPLALQQKVLPQYPHDAYLIRKEGAVVMMVTVNEKGQVSQIKQMSGDPMLGRAAISAIRQWRYRPAELNGKPTQSETQVTLNFKLP